MGGGTLLGNSNPPGPIKLCSQSTAGIISSALPVRFTSLNKLQKCWPKTILLSQTGISTNSAKMLGQNHAAQPNWDVLTFLRPVLICK
jgi:hypothetical protein